MEFPSRFDDPADLECKSFRYSRNSFPYCTLQPIQTMANKPWIEFCVKGFRNVGLTMYIYWKENHPNHNEKVMISLNVWDMVTVRWSEGSLSRRVLALNYRHGGQEKAMTLRGNDPSEQWLFGTMTLPSSEQWTCLRLRMLSWYFTYYLWCIGRTTGLALVKLSQGKRRSSCSRIFSSLHQFSLERPHEGAPLPTLKPIMGIAVRPPPGTVQNESRRT